MRLLSGLTLLFYLCLLWTPQAFALHDPRIAPVAEQQLLAVPAALQQGVLNTPQQPNEPDHSALPSSFTLPLSLTPTICWPTWQRCWQHPFYTFWQARAPPKHPLA